MFCGTQRRERHSKHIAINKKLHSPLKLSSSSSPKWFCNKLKNITGQTNNISKDKWKTHFESLFSNNAQNDDNEYTDDVVIDIEYDISENELEDIIFNSEITDEEIIKKSSSRTKEREV